MSEPMSAAEARAERYYAAVPDDALCVCCANACPGHDGPVEERGVIKSLAGWLCAACYRECYLRGERR